MTLFHIVLSIFGTITWATEVVTSKPVADIYWNKTNEMFQPTNNHHIIDVNLKDTIQFLCPHYEPDQGNNSELEHYIIYRLPKQYYDSCYLPVNMNENQLRQQGIEKVHNCSSPYEELNYIVYIDDFYALPGAFGGLSYKPGQTYYFTSISTGTLSGLHNRLSEGSACRKHNMKAVVRVCCSDNATFTCPEGSIKCSNSTKAYSTKTSTPAVTSPESVRVTDSVVTTTIPSQTVSTASPTIRWTTLTSHVASKATDANSEGIVGDNSSTSNMISTAILLCVAIFHTIL